MSINIKNKEAYHLTKQLSELTGESLTAITEAVRERLDRVRAVSEALILPNASYLLGVTAPRTSGDRSAPSIKRTCSMTIADCQNDYPHVDWRV